MRALAGLGVRDPMDLRRPLSLSLSCEAVEPAWSVWGCAPGYRGELVAPDLASTCGARLFCAAPSRRCAESGWLRVGHRVPAVVDRHRGRDVDGTRFGLARRGTHASVSHERRWGQVVLPH